MNTREMLLRAVLENPAEDTVRLAFADWCGEDGESDYAEFIRGQVRGERVRVGTNRFRQWFAPWWGYGKPFGLSHNRGATRAAVRDAVGYGGGVRVGPGPDCIVVSRGFVGEIHLPCAAFLTHAKALFSAHPVEKVVLTDRVAAHYPGDYGSPWTWAWRECEGEEERLMIERADSFVPLRVWKSVPVANWCYHKTEKESLDALSVACVAYGRSLAGLTGAGVAA